MSTIQTKLDQIATLKAKLQTLENEVLAEQQKRLSSLHKEVGLDSSGELIRALDQLSQKPKTQSKKPRRKRSKITPAVKQKVAIAVKAGKKGSEIARQIGISIPSIQNIKKELGLIKARKAKKSTKQATKKIPKKTTKPKPKKTVKAVKKTTKKST